MRELHEVNDAIIHLLSSNDELQAKTVSSIINEMSLHILSKPQSAEVLPLIAQGWEGMRSLTSVILTRTLASRAQRVSIMYMNYTAWRWLDMYIMGICVDMLRANVMKANDWLARLLRDIKSHFYIRSKDPQVFNMTTYLPKLTTTTYMLASARSRLPVDDTKHDDIIIASITLILQCWLNYPTDAIAKQQACLIHAIVTEYSINTLYLDGIWEAYRALNGRAKYIGPWRVSTSLKGLRHDKQYTEVHPLSNHNSLESRTLQDIADLLKGLGNNSHLISHLSNTSNDDLSVLYFEHLLPQLRKLAH